MVHRIYKGIVPHTNKKNVEFDLIKRDNTLQTLRYLLDGGQDNHFENVGRGIQNIVKDDALRSLLDNWYIFSLTYDDNDDLDMRRQGRTLCVYVLVLFYLHAGFIM